MSQQELADMIGVAYQQAQKYETGVNRVSAGQLYQIARVLNIPITYFFEGLNKTSGSIAPRERMLLEISRNFVEIQDEKHREMLSQVIRVLAGR